MPLQLGTRWRGIAGRAAACCRCGSNRSGTQTGVLVLPAAYATPQLQRRCATPAAAPVRKRGQGTRAGMSRLSGWFIRSVSTGPKSATPPMSASVRGGRGNTGGGVERRGMVLLGCALLCPQGRHAQHQRQRCVPACSSAADFVRSCPSPCTPAVSGSYLVVPLLTHRRGAPALGPTCFPLDPHHAWLSLNHPPPLPPTDVASQPALLRGPRLLLAALLAVLLCIRGCMARVK